MSTFNLSNFSTEVLSGAGLSRTNRFEIIISKPAALSDPDNICRLASLYVEQTSIPPINILVKPYKIFGPAYQRPITSEYGGDSIAMVFHVDRDMKVRKFFEDWMHLVVNPQNFTVGYLEEYSATITIIQLNDRDEITHSIDLLHAFPRNTNLMELNNASTNQTHRLNVNFAYHYWKRTSVSRPVDVPRPIVKPQVSTEDSRVVYPSSPLPSRQWNWSTGSLESDQGSDLPPSP